MTKKSAYIRGMNHPSPRAFIFDMDGTIVDNIPYHFKAWEQVFLDHGRVFDPVTFHARNTGTIEETVRKFFGDDLTLEEVYQVGEEKESAYRRLYQPHVKELDGLTSLLKRAATNGIHTALATMGGPANIDMVMQELGITDLFHFIIGGHQVSKGKPDPEIFQKAIAHFGIEPAHTLVFEDSHPGVKAALAAGADVVGICTTHSKEEFREWGVERTIDNYETFSRLYFPATS